MLLKANKLKTDLLRIRRTTSEGAWTATSVERENTECTTPMSSRGKQMRPFSLVWNPPRLHAHQEYVLINNSRKMVKLNIGERLSQQIKASRYVKRVNALKYISLSLEVLQYLRISAEGKTVVQRALLVENNQCRWTSFPLLLFSL